VRKKRLKAVLPKSPLVTYSEHWVEHGKRLFKEAEKLGLEGIMAKRAQSKYLSGARSKDWLKIKTARRQEVVIVGFTAPKRTRPYFAGFSHALLKGLHAKMVPLRTPSPPFKQRIKAKAETTWVKPKLVAEVRFTEWTGDGEIRHPAFLGLREDKKATDVVLEKESHHPEATS
jgi:bifunctional non-homologous end joining protein LigD